MQTRIDHVRTVHVPFGAFAESAGKSGRRGVHCGGGSEGPANATPPSGAATARPGVQDASVAAQSPAAGREST